MEQHNMEEKHAQLTDEQYLAQLIATQGLAQQAKEETAAPMPEPPRAPARVRPARKRSPYRQWALLLAGLACYVLLIMLAALLWGSLVFMRQGDVGEAAAMPLAIFLGAVFLSCLLVTTLSRGGTIFPAFNLALIVNILPFLLLDSPQPQPGAIAIRLGYTLLVAIAGFALSKLLYIKNRGRRLGSRGQKLEVGN